MKKIVLLGLGYQIYNMKDSPVSKSVMNGTRTFKARKIIKK